MFVGPKFTPSGPTFPHMGGKPELSHMVRISRPGKFPNWKRCVANIFSLGRLRGGGGGHVSHRWESFGATVSQLWDRRALGFLPAHPHQIPVPITSTPLEIRLEAVYGPYRQYTQFTQFTVVYGRGSLRSLPPVFAVYGSLR